MSKEMADLPHEISKPLHQMSAAYYVGGSSPRLACVLTKLIMACRLSYCKFVLLNQTKARRTTRSK
eukprot:64212-Hanusia_phi.AAC.1